MKALVIGGTGPSGLPLVNGLLQRGYEVAVLHGGQHEVEFSGPVEHIHTDPHFVETLEAGLRGRSFDLTVATYGRIRLVADVMKGKTPRLITVGGGGVYASRTDPRWGPLGPPAKLPEDGPMADDPKGPRMGHLMWVTEQAIMQAHRDGHYEATIFRYPLIYGPHAPANPDWSIVRRVLDGRRQIIVATGEGPRRRAFGENAAHAVLLGVDRPKVAAGQAYNVREDAQHTQRQLIAFMAAVMGREVEIIEVPPALAARVYRGAGAQSEGGGSDYDITKLKADLGYRDVVPPAEGVRRSVEWLAANRPEPGGEIEQQLGDPFAYDAEDQLVLAYRQGITQAEAVRFPEVHSGHMYRHPTRPGEVWAPPARR